MITSDSNTTTLAELIGGSVSENEPVQAEAHSREVLRRQPNDVGALAILGYALHAQGRFNEAEDVFAKLTLLDPAESIHWMNLGTARRCSGNPDDALHAFANAAALGAASADFYYNLALAHLDRNDFESARVLLIKALELAPGDLEIRYRYAQCCFERQRTEEALAALADWETYFSAPNPVAADIGHLLMLLGEPERAERTIDLVATQGVGSPQTRLKLIQLLERTNRIVEARAALDNLLSDTGSAGLGVELLLTRAQLAQRESQHDLACRLFREVLASRKDFHLRHFDQYPLAKSLDALGRYDEAFEVLLEAHRSQSVYLKRAAPLASLRGAPMMIIADYGCDAVDVQAWNDPSAPSAADSPIFIVAFPRSGTTLLELTLDAHPLLRSMDEQPFLQNALDDLVATGVRYPDQLGKLTGHQLEEVRIKYWQRTQRKVALQPGQRLVDKNPLNLLRLPVIKRLFPNARILLAIRHPGDVILSCFMQHFRAPEFALLCQDLRTLANGYRRAFDFWYEQQALLGAKVRELRYESFVADFESETRAIFDFLELPWDEAVLKPGNRAVEKKFISTPSYSQVVQPINSKAVGRWTRYREHFGEVLPIVQPYLDRWDYES